MTPLPFGEYAAQEGLSQSALKPILTSPAHFQQSLKAARKDTPALKFGRAADIAAFEPHRFALEFAVEPENDGSINRRTKKGKEQWKALIAAIGNRALLTRDEHDRAWACGEAVRSSFAAPYLVGRKQSALKWTDERTGLLCKARLDVDGDDFTSDLKTCLSVDAGSFGRDVAKYLYHFQASYYRQGVRAVRGRYLPYFLVAVEKFPPHDVGVFEVDGDALQRGNELVRLALDRYAACVKSGKWPGRYSRPESVDFPKYAMFADEEDETTTADGPITY